MRAGQLQMPKRRAVGAQLVGYQQFRHKPLLSEKLAHQPQRRPAVAATLDQPLSGKRLLTLWNGLPGVEKRRKVGDRDALIEQLWSAIEALPDPDAKRPSKQDEVIAMLRRPEGATVDEVVSVTGWQRHTVRSPPRHSCRASLSLPADLVRFALNSPLEGADSNPRSPVAKG